MDRRRTAHPSHGAGGAPCRVDVDVLPAGESRSRWLALTAAPGRVRVVGPYSDAAAAQAVGPGAAVTVTRARVDDAVPGQPGAVTLRRYCATGCAGDSEAVGWHLAGAAPTRARAHRRACGGLPGLASWLAAVRRPLPLVLVVTAMLAGFTADHALGYLAVSDWIGWPSTLEDVLREVRSLRLSPDDVLACLTFGLCETDAGCPTWRHGRGRMVLDVAARARVSPVKVAHYLAAGATPEQILACMGRPPDVVDLTPPKRLPTQREICPALTSPNRIRGWPAGPTGWAGPKGGSPPPATPSLRS